MLPSPKEVLLTALNNVSDLCHPVRDEPESAREFRRSELKRCYEGARAAGAELGSPRISSVLEHFAPLADSHNLEDDQRKALCMELSLLMCQIRTLTPAQLSGQQST